MPRPSLISMVGVCFFSSSVAPRLFTAAAAWLKRAILGKRVWTRCRSSVMCWGASFIHASAGRPSWKKPIPIAVARRHMTTAAESAGGIWRHDAQRMTGFNVIAAAQARKTGRITGRAKNKKATTASTARTASHGGVSAVASGSPGSDPPAGAATVPAGGGFVPVSASTGCCIITMGLQGATTADGKPPAVSAGEMSAAVHLPRASARSRSGPEFGGVLSRGNCRMTCGW